MLYALDDVHFEFHASFPEPSSQLFLHLPQKMLPGGVAVRLNGDVHADSAVEILHSIALVVRDVMLCHHPSTWDTSTQFHVRQRGIQNFLADQIKKNVNP